MNDPSMTELSDSNSKQQDSRDRYILERITHQDQAAMRVFYDTYAGLVQHFAQKTVVNSADAVEVLNEVMMEVWRKAASFDGRSKVRTWLLSITHNKSVDLVRRKSRHDVLSNIDDESIDDDSCGLDCAKSTLEDKTAVQKCLKGLKPGHRYVVYLTFFEELSYSEIAQIIEVPAGTVKTRMMHAKAALQKCLSGILA